MDALLLQAIGPAIARLAALLPTVTRPNTAKLEGLTFEELSTQVLLNTVANAVQIGGKSPADLQAAFDSANQDVQDQQAQLTAFIARRDNPHLVTAEQIVLDLMLDAGIATLADFDANAVDKYVNPAIMKAAVDAAIDQLIGDAPESMDTLQEIAAILKDDPQIINNLLNQVGGLLSVAEAKALFDKMDADLRTYADAEFAKKLVIAETHSDTNVQTLVDILTALGDQIAPPPAPTDTGVNPDGPLFGYSMSSAENAGFKVSDTAHFEDCFGWRAFDKNSAPVLDSRKIGGWYPASDIGTATILVEAKEPKTLRHMRLLHDVREYVKANPGNTNLNQAWVDSIKPYAFKVQASNDGNVWVDLRTLDKNLFWESNGDTTSHADVIFQNETAYKFYRFQAAGSNGTFITNVQLSGVRPVGEDVLLAGDKNLGYYGPRAAADVVTATQFVQRVGAISGTPINNNTDWLKFAYKGKTLYVARLPIRSGCVFSNLNGNGLVTGSGGVAQILFLKDTAYGRVRALRGVNGPNNLSVGATVTDAAPTRNTEFNDLMYRVCVDGGLTGEDKWAEYSLEGLGFSNNYGPGSATICAESWADDRSVLRGFAGLKSVHFGSFSGAVAARGYRPVIEFEMLKA